MLRGSKWGRAECSRLRSNLAPVLPALHALAGAHLTLCTRCRAVAMGARILLCLVLAKCALAQNFTCAAGNDATQCAALRDLYYATNGRSWGDKSGWSSAAAGVPTDYCTFAGISCAGNNVTWLCVPGGSAGRGG